MQFSDIFRFLRRFSAGAALAAALAAPAAAQTADSGAAAGALTIPDTVPVPKPKYIPPQQAEEPTGRQAAPPAAAPATAGAAAAERQAQQNLPVPSPAPAGNSGSAAISLAEAQQLAQNLADKFSQIRTMMGDFVQFDPRGGMSTGTFYLERPGRILFDYHDTPVRVICDGQAIAVNNRKLGSWNLYDLSKSPLNLLLADRINIANGRLLEFTQEQNATILVLGDATGHSKIRMIFDPQTYELKQWTMTDNGQDTTIQIVNARTGVQFADNMFSIAYYRSGKKRN